MKVALLGVKGEFDKALGQGVQRYMYEMYHRLRGMDRKVQIEKLEFDYIPKMGNNISFVIQTLFEDFDGYDIIHRMDQKPLFLLKRGKAILISTSHDFQAFLSDSKYKTSSLKEKVWIPINTLGMRSTLDSDYIIARSTQTRDELIERGYDRRRITVVSDGVDERYFTKARKKGKGHRFTAGYLSSFAINKNPVFAVNAFKKTASMDMKFEVWGKRKLEYNNLVRAAKDDKRILFKGFAPEEKIVEIYDGFDVFLFPSIYEGFGIPILEAQARGLPVIILKDSRIPKEVRKYCLEAKDEDEMAGMIEDLKMNGYNEKLKKRSTAYARSFTWQKEAREHLKVYKKVLSLNLNRK